MGLSVPKKADEQDEDVHVLRDYQIPNSALQQPTTTY